MTAVAAINEPFLLSTYSVTQRTSKSSKRQTGIYASYQKPSSNSDGFVSVAAQSDGVHVLDVATLHPIISHTLGPSTTFACAPLTQHQTSKNTHATYAVIASSTDTDIEHQGKTIWKWTENLSSPLTDRSSSKNQHETLMVPHLVSGLHDCDELRDRVLAISPAGDISLFTVDMKLKTTRPPSAEGNNIISSHIFSQASCSFLKSQSEGAVLVLVVRGGGSMQVEVYSVDNNDAINLTLVHEIPLIQQDIATTSCSPSGILNIISYTGHWHTFSISLSSLSPVSSPIQLTGLSFINPLTTSSLSNKAQSQKKVEKAPPTPSLLALTSSHVLLASPTPENEIALLLWDSQYSILLASHLLPLPSSLNTRASSLNCTLLSPSGAGVKAGSQQAVLVIAQSTSQADGKTLAKSSVYIVPYGIPARATLANAIGRTNAGARWLNTSGSAAKQRQESPQEAARSKLISGMRSAVDQNRPQAANMLFTEWEKGQEQAEFGYTFVKDVLEVIIQPQKPPNPLYSSEIVRNLIKKGVVRSAMAEGTLLPSLRIRNDWPSIDLALRHIPDLSENELIETLSAVTNSALASTSTDPDAMQVDSTNLNQLPTLRDFLATLLLYRQFTAPQLILAFRQHLRSAESITLVAQVLDEWIKVVQGQEMKLLPSKKDVAKNEFGALVVKEGTGKPKTNLPSMKQILDFLQSLLDASFLILLQHPPAHNVLRSLKTHIEPEIAALSQTEQLRGLVEGFAKAHAKAVKDAEASRGGGGPVENGESKDWRQRRKEAREQVGVVVGMYQLEELVL